MRWTPLGLASTIRGRSASFMLPQPFRAAFEQLDAAIATIHQEAALAA
jgi:hypothetical protein